MRGKWKQKLLLSYVPAFLIIVFAIIVMIYFVMVDVTRNQTERAHEAFTAQVMEMVDAKLQSIDQMIMNEIQENKTLHDFFRSAEQYDQFGLFEMTGELGSLVHTSPLIDSIYVVRFLDGMIISNQRIITESDQFADQAYLQKVTAAVGAQSWSTIRNFQLFESDYQRQVLTLARQSPLFSGTQGVVVININVYKLRLWLDSIAGDGLGYVQLSDAEDNVILSVEHGQASYGDRDGATAHSNYSGWTLKTGFKYQDIISSLTTISYIWIVLIGCSLLLGITWFWFSVRRNYQPVQALLQKIRTTRLLKSSAPGEKETRDEFGWIESSWDDLVGQFENIEKKVSEDAGYKSQQIFEKWISGRFLPAVREVALTRGFTATEGRYCYVAVEIDQYMQFSTDYSPNDQDLLKYAVKKVSEEIADLHECKVWCEWINPSRMGVVLGLPHGAGNGSIKHLIWCEMVAKWCKENVNLTLTLGIGLEVDTLEEIAKSAAQANDALDYKPILGGNRMILYSEIETMAEVEEGDHTDRIIKAINAIKYGEKKWENKLDEVFKGFHRACLTRAELERYCSYFIIQLNRDLAALPPGPKRYWEDIGKRKMNQALEQYHDIFELETRWTEILAELALVKENAQQEGKQSGILKELKQFIDRKYKDRNMSLSLVSMEFELNPSYLSRLFNEAFGQRYVDYLAGLRVEEAKRLLQSTDLPIHEIAEQVGYIHSFSFIRAFKKAEGVTPGEYKKLHDDGLS